MTSTPPPLVTARPAATVALAKPKVGGIYNNVPFTGGTRDPLRARSFPTSPYMERDQNTVMKVWKACDSGIKEEFKLKKSAERDMHSFKTKINNTLKNYCCDSVFYMTKNSQLVYLVESPDALSIGKICAQEATYRADCQYVLANNNNDNNNSTNKQALRTVTTTLAPPSLSSIQQQQQHAASSCATGYGAVG